MIGIGPRKSIDVYIVLLDTFQTQSEKFNSSIPRMNKKKIRTYSIEQQLNIALIPVIVLVGWPWYLPSLSGNIALMSTR